MKLGDELIQKIKQQRLEREIQEERFWLFLGNSITLEGWQMLWRGCYWQLLKLRRN